MAVVAAIIFRVEGASERPHSSLEAVANPDDGIWILDHDILPDEQDKVPYILKEILEVASEVNEKFKFLHIALGDGGLPFRLPPSLLSSVAKANCILEVEA